MIADGEFSRIRRRRKDGRKEIRTRFFVSRIQDHHAATVGQITPGSKEDSTQLQLVFPRSKRNEAISSQQQRRRLCVHYKGSLDVRPMLAKATRSVLWSLLISKKAGDEFDFASVQHSVS